MDGASVGTPFGRYRLIELLGRGGMGEVWRAHDTVTDRVVAIKVLTTNLSEDEDFQQRFRREAHAAARLDTPHVVPIYDYGEIDDRLFVSMRLIRGRDLATVLAEGSLDPARAVRIIEQIAKALHAAHKVDLIHRDIKPSNILLDDDDFAYLIDFGIARMTDETRMTKTGNTIGTFAYIAPERLDGRAEEDARVDIYSLACVLYEALTGEPPFAGDTMPRLIAAHLNTPPPRPSIAQPEVPASVDEVIATGMAKDPDQRYETTVELAKAAREAITVPVQQPTANPTRLRETQPAPNPAAAESATVHSELAPTMAQFASPATQDQPAISAPRPPSAPSRIRAGRITRRTRIALALGAAVILAAALAVTIHVTRGHQAPNPLQSVLPFTDLGSNAGVAADAAGNVYVTDRKNNRVLKLPAGSSSQEVLPFTGIGDPSGVAVDVAGNVYVTDYQNNRVLKLPAGSSSQEVLPFAGLELPSGVAVDGAGSVYVIDQSKQVAKLPAGASQEALPLSGLGDPPAAVAVDGAGNVYVSTVDSRVLKLPAGSSGQEVLPFTGLSFSEGLAVDGAGNLYVGDTHNNRVLKLPAGSSSQEVLWFTGLNFPEGVAVDAAGNLYVADAHNNRVVKLASR